MRATRSIVICTTPRSGSTLLCRYLAATGHAGNPQEYLLESALPVLYERQGARDFPSYFEALLSREATPNGVFAIKLMGVPDGFEGYLARLRELPGLGDPERPPPELLAAAFPGVRYVWLTRRDRLRQALSLLRAQASGRWQSTQAAPRSPIAAAGEGPGGAPDLGAVDDAITDLVSWDAAWEGFFAQAGVRPVSLVYEDLVRDPRATLHELLAALGIALPAEWKPGPPERSRLADETTERWLSAYRREAKRARARARRRAAAVDAGEYLRPETLSARELGRRVPASRLLKALLARLLGGGRAPAARAASEPSDVDPG